MVSQVTKAEQTWGTVWVWPEVQLPAREVEAGQGIQGLLVGAVPSLRSISAIMLEKKANNDFSLHRWS